MKIPAMIWHAKSLSNFNQFKPRNTPCWSYMVAKLDLYPSWSNAVLFKLCSATRLTDYTASEIRVSHWTTRSVTPPTLMTTSLLQRDCHSLRYSPRVFKYKMPQSKTNFIKLHLNLFQFNSNKRRASISLFECHDNIKKMLCKYYAKFISCINHLIYQFHNHSCYMSFHLTHSHVSIQFRYSICSMDRLNWMFSLLPLQINHKNPLSYKQREYWSHVTDYVYAFNLLNAAEIYGNM
jgi:hypothetical protein